MELLLWMWFYEPKWFMNLTVSWETYQFIWMFPLAVHLFLATIGFTLMYITEYSSNNALLVAWLSTRTFFSIVLILAIIAFLYNNRKLHEEDKQFRSEAVLVFRESYEVKQNSNYWLIRKSLTSRPGIFIFFLGLISLGLSFLMIRFYYLENKFVGCTDDVLQFLDFQLYIILSGDVPLVFVLSCFFLLKIGSLVCAYICPGLLNNSSETFKPKIIQLQSYKTI